MASARGRAAVAAACVALVLVGCSSPPPLLSVDGIEPIACVDEHFWESSAVENGGWVEACWEGAGVAVPPDVVSLAAQRDLESRYPELSVFGGDADFREIEQGSRVVFNVSGWEGSTASFPSVTFHILLSANWPENLRGPDGPESLSFAEFLDAGGSFDYLIGYGRPPRQ